jgi:imidazole glycerol-phosphate synthase subunit HisH
MKINKIVVVDYGMGNLSSILNMLKKVGVTADLSNNPNDILKADKLILPGVGAFDNAIRNLKKKEYVQVLNQKILVEKTPILGICLGMQLFSKKSEEGYEQGLGWIDAQTVRFKFENSNFHLKIPHMGWNYANVCQKSHLFPNYDLEYRFYFVHSFHVQCNNPIDVLAWTDYGQQFTSAICHGNILGTQFHPEKSHRFGLEFFKAFAAWVPSNRII